MESAAFSFNPTVSRPSPLLQLSQAAEGWVVLFVSVLLSAFLTTWALLTAAFFGKQKTEGRSITTIFALLLAANGKKTHLADTLENAGYLDMKFFETALQDWFQKVPSTTCEAGSQVPKNKTAGCEPSKNYAIDLVEPLTKREIEVLQLVAEGLTNKEIAHRLFLSECTIKFHINSIYTKMGVHGRMQAAISGRAIGLLQ